MAETYTLIKQVRYGIGDINTAESGDNILEKAFGTNTPKIISLGIYSIPGTSVYLNTSNTDSLNAEVLIGPTGILEINTSSIIGGINSLIIKKNVDSNNFYFIVDILYEQTN
jgi:hypothetical protein